MQCTRVGLLKVKFSDRFSNSLMNGDTLTRLTFLPEMCPDSF